jgi:tetratricopeptide (TPR) repeat protein
MIRRVKPIGPVPVTAILMGSIMTGCIDTGGRGVKQELPDFDRMWNYNDPAATEAMFRECLLAAERSGDRSYHAQLLTQIARTQGLQDRIDDAHATLDSVEKMLTDDLTLAGVRYLLERGRVFNSSGQPAKAMPLFEQAWKLAEPAGLPRYAIDAVHMLAIAAPTPREQIEWNLRGLAMVEKDSSQKGWLHALYNNLGESYARVDEHARALDAFEKLAAINGHDMYTMKDQARMLRLTGQVNRATAIIRRVPARRRPRG